MAPARFSKEDKAAADTWGQPVSGSVLAGRRGACLVVARGVGTWAALLVLLLCSARLRLGPRPKGEGGSTWVRAG